MKLFYALLITFLSFTTWSQNDDSKKTERNIQVFFDYKNFASNGVDNYIETYLQFTSFTIEHKLNKHGNLQGELEITQIIKQEDEIVDYKKYSLKTPEIMDSIYEDFTDVQRFSLQPGLYEMELIIKDVMSSPVKEVTANQPIKVEPLNDDHISVSDIELIAAATQATGEATNYTKSGFNIIPQVTNFYDETTNKIAYYIEIYRSDQFIPENGFVLKQSIEQYQTGKPVPGTVRMKRMTSAPVIPYIGTILTEDLSSGNYSLVIELLDKNQELLFKKSVFFQRSNPPADIQMQDLSKINIEASFTQEIPRDSLLFNFESIFPIASINERKTVVKEIRRIKKSGEFTDSDAEGIRKFLHAFWTHTDALEPDVAFYKYQEQVHYVEEQFSSNIKEGFRTDQGRVYLQYGPPNSVVDRPNEPSSYPYQVWHYYKIGNFSNKKFIFYQPDLVSNDYRILHSDLQGEINNYRWQHVLNKRNSPAGNLDDPNDGNIDHFGGNSNQYFINDY